MEIRFFEKPGCINNTRQKGMLAEAGHFLHVFSLLTYRWEKEELRSFFGNLPVNEWFNPSAPAIKEGKITPKNMDEEKALEAMLADPLLIRRPLIEADGQRSCGFDNPLVKALTNNKDASHLQNCPNMVKQEHCN